MKEYMAWDAEYYDCKFRMFPHKHEVHGPFFAKSEADLKAQMVKQGLDPLKLRWEVKKRRKIA